MQTEGIVIIVVCAVILVLAVFFIIFVCKCCQEDSRIAKFWKKQTVNK
jgi:hypothetical protein